MARKPIATAASPAPVPAEALTAPEAVAAPAQAAAAFDTTVASLKHSVAGAIAGQSNPQNEVKATMDKAVKSAEEFVSFSQGNFQAMMQASQIWAAGVQDLGRAMTATAQ